MDMAIFGLDIIFILMMQKVEMVAVFHYAVTSVLHPGARAGCASVSALRWVHFDQVWKLGAGSGTGTCTGTL